MGKIIVSENVTLDGVIQEPAGADGADGSGRSWVTRITDKDREAWAKVEFEEALGAEALLMGRHSYEWFLARGWASRGGEWADRLRALSKYVVSSSELERPGWENTTALAGEVVKAVATLKEEVSGEIVVYGSGRLVHTLMEHDLIDELRLMTFPIVAGTGERLFGPTSALKPVRLLEVRTVGAGIAFGTYQPVRDA